MQAAYGGTSTLFRVLEAMSSLKVFISSSVYVKIDPGTSYFVASPFCLIELLLAIFWDLFTGFFVRSRCREGERFFMPLQELVVQFKTRKNLRLTLKNAFVCFWLFKR